MCGDRATLMSAVESWHAGAMSIEKKYIQDVYRIYIYKKVYKENISCLCMEFACFRCLRWSLGRQVRRI